MSVPARPLVPGAGRRPIQTRDDVLAQLPALIKRPDLAPIRDRLCDALLGIMAEYQFRSDISAAQADVLRATGIYLAVLGSDFGVTKQEGEDEEAYRDRILLPDGVATEAAIIAGVNTILSLVTDKQCVLLDAQLDQWFVRSASPVLLAVGSIIESASGGASITVPIPDVPAGSLLILQVGQQSGTAADIPGWTRLGANVTGNSCHTVFTKDAAGSDPPVTVQLAGLFGYAQANCLAWRASIGGVQAVTGTGTALPAPTIQPGALMLSLGFSNLLPFVTLFGGWNVLVNSRGSGNVIFALDALDSDSPTNTAGSLSSPLPWSLFNIALYPVGGLNAWQSFPEASPVYPDRLYESDAALNDGDFRPNSTPTGAHMFSVAGAGLDVPEGSQLGRKFLLLLPDLIGRDDNNAYVSTADSDLWTGSGMWVASNSTPTLMQAYMQSASESSFTTYRAIESFVNAVAGQSIRWCAIGEL